MYLRVQIIHFGIDVLVALVEILFEKELSFLLLGMVGRMKVGNGPVKIF